MKISLLFSSIQTYVNFKWVRFLDILLAPILLHFGHISWVVDLAIIILNLTITQFFFYFFIFLVVASFFDKNSDAAVFRRKIFRRLSFNFNKVVNFFPHNTFFSTLKVSILVFSNFLKNLKF